MAYANRNKNNYASKQTNFQSMAYNNGQNWGNQAPTNKTIVKHSGCTTGTDKNGKRYTQGWMVRKGTMYNFLCTPTKHSTEVTAKTTGNKFLTGIVISVTSTRGRGMKNQIVNKKGKDGSPLFWGMMDLRTGQVTCEDLGLVFNPKGGKGGYSGPYGGR